ncbi:MAG: hypothetical protein RJA34_2530 [Pseudomonadota bacterium]|jgi:DNA-binding NarL/FixJ family response regulator
MSTEHLFLVTPASAAPARWSEAFAQGRALEAQALLDWVRSHDVSHALVWLSTVDAQWLTHLKAIIKLQADAKVLVVSNVPDPREGLLALNDGARGYTHAYAVPALLQEVALVVSHGGLWVGPDLMQRLVSSTSAALASRSAIASAMAEPTVSVVLAGNASSPAAVHSDALSALSAREAEVARAVTAGRSNKEVAELLHISERTVKAHLGMVFEKLGVRDRLQLVLRLSGPGGSGATPSGKAP